MDDTEPAVRVPLGEETKEGSDEEQSGVQNVDALMKSYELEEEQEQKPKENGTDGERQAQEEREGEGGAALESNGKELLVVEEEDGDRENLGPRDDIKVTVTGYQKTVDNCTFDVEVEVNGGQTKLIHRSYSDLLWLHRNLARRVELGGYILPPMAAPPPKTQDPKVAVLGETSRALFGDHNRLPCLAVEVFLQALADHRFFAENDTVHTYIAKDQVSDQDHLGGGTLWSHFTKALSDYQLNSVQSQDTDDDFTKFLKYIESLLPQLQTCAQNFAKLVLSQQTLAVAIVTMIDLSEEYAGWEIERNERCGSLFQKFVEGVEEEKRYLHSTSLDARHTIGFTFDLYHKYCQQAKEMLYRRLQKLHHFVSCMNQLDKAKPQKKEEAERAKESADEAFKAISKTAKKEIDLFHQHYTKSFRTSLLSFAESQVEHSKKTYDNLARLRDELVAL